MEWIGDVVTGQGVTEQRFDVICEGRRVPGILWMPEQAREVGALALLGHGGGLDKRADYILGTARRLVRRHGISAIAIDGPGHGDRRSTAGDRAPENSEAEFQKAWSPADATDKMVEDWKAALDAIQSEKGEGPVGYFGLSMGTMMGVPLIASEPRVQAAVLGLMGVWGPNRERLASDSPNVQCPVRFLAQWDDEVVPRETALELFDRLGTKHKSLHAHPGKHVQVPADEMRAIPDFLAAHLR